MTEALGVEITAWAAMAAFIVANALLVWGRWEVRKCRHLLAEVEAQNMAVQRALTLWKMGLIEPALNTLRNACASTPAKDDRASEATS